MAPTPDQHLKAIRNMRLASDIFAFCFEVKKAQLQRRYPEYDAQQLVAETIKALQVAPP